MGNNSNQKKRHVLTTIWLSIILIGNGLATPFYLMGHPEIKKSLPQAPDLFWPIYGSLGIVVVICCIALFMWKKWGFWGICMTSALATVSQLLYGFGYKSFIGPSAVLLLFGLLKLGKENSAWKHLE
ncbi:MAG: hypothetical protein ACYS21_14270 [Planctomycetota bacterium]|jgi:hypothetical protein